MRAAVLKARPPIADPAVGAVFAGYPAGLRGPLLALRRLILETATATPAVGAVTETLKWGEPAYRPQRPRTGTTLRIAPLRGRPDRYGLFVNCRTTLLEDFRQRYPGQFRFEGSRALLFAAAEPPPAEALRHCIALALTYHLRD